MSTDEIGKRIRARRTQLNMSLDDLSRKTGYAKTTLQRYETQDNGNMSTTKIAKLADALDVTPSYLMGWESLGLKNSYKLFLDNIFDQFHLICDYEANEDSYYVAADCPKTENEEVVMLPVKYRKDVKVFRYTAEQLNEFYEHVLSAIQVEFFKLNNPHTSYVMQTYLEPITDDPIATYYPKGFDYQKYTFTDAKSAKEFLLSLPEYNENSLLVDNMSDSKAIENANSSFNFDDFNYKRDH